MSAAVQEVAGLPDMKVSVRQQFGIDSDMEVPAYSAPNEHVPETDPDYRFDRATTHLQWTADSGALLSLVALFALGILASMSLFGIVLAHTLAARRMTGHVTRLAAAATAAGSLALGVYWITAL